MYDGNMGPADVAAVMRNNNGYNDGMGFGGGMWFWWIILFLFFGMGGWGNGWGNNANTPNIDRIVQNGFDQSAVITAINNVNSVLTNLGLQLSDKFAQVEVAANARQIADMNQQFAFQSAVTGQMNGLGMGIEGIKYTVADQACQNRNQSMQNTRDIIDAIRQGNQGIMDKLCALELEGVKGQLAQAQRDNVALQNQLNMATIRESQTAQNAFIQQGFANEVDQLYNRLSNCPVPSTPVYGRTPIFTCGGNNGYNGCGCMG